MALSTQQVRAEPGELAPAKAASSASRQRVLDAALCCFAREGFHGTSMQTICAEAKMSPGALYRHFPSKDHIIEAIAVAEREQDSRFLAQISTDANIVDTLIEVGLARLCALGASDT